MMVKSVKEGALDIHGVATIKGDREVTEATKQVGIAELGTMLNQGLQFLDGDIDKALGVVIGKHTGAEVLVQRHVPAVKGDLEKGLVDKAEIPEVKFVVSEETRKEILGAIASLPLMRPLFSGQVADAINRGREGDESYSAKVDRIEQLKDELAEIYDEIHEFDQSNIEGFSIDDFVHWYPTYEVSPKSFASAIAATRKRSASAVKWVLDEYKCNQDSIEGPNASFHNISLVRSGNQWNGVSDEGVLSTESSPNKVMQEILIAAGLSPHRSANEFWNGAETEKAAGV